MNLYIIKKVLTDYTSGMVVIAATSLERARELFLDSWGERLVEEYDASIADGTYKVLQVVDQDERVVAYVYGGG